MFGYDVALGGRSIDLCIYWRLILRYVTSPCRKNAHVYAAYESRHSDDFLMFASLYSVPLPFLSSSLTNFFPSPS